MSGLTSPHVNRYMSGQHLPRVEHVVAIARSCGVSVDWLLGVNDIGGPTPDRKVGIPEGITAAVDFEAVRRFLAGEKLGDRDIIALEFDQHVRLVDAQEFATVRRQLDDAAKARNRKTRRSRPSD